MTGLQPTIEGMTDLPDGTELVILIFKPWLPDGQQRLAAGLSACENDCMPAKGPEGSTVGSPTVVKNGHFSVGPFSFNNSPFHRGIFYPVEINSCVLDTFQKFKLMKNNSPLGQAVVRVILAVARFGGPNEERGPLFQIRESRSGCPSVSWLSKKARICFSN